MPQFEAYEPGEEISPGLNRARDPRRNIDVLIRTANAEQAGDLSPETLVGRAEAQQAAADLEFWLPVLDLDRNPEHPRVVFPACPDSIDRYLSFTAVEEPVVWRVMHDLVRALEEYRQVAGRPHGNLKPTNILLESTRGAWWRTIRLTDPLSSAELEPPMPWRRDLRDVGRLLFRLVLQRPPEPGEIPSSDEPWMAALGSNGGAWRKLCADLLDPAYSIDLDTLRQRLDDLQPKQPRSRRFIRLAAILIPIIVIPLGTLQWPTDPNKIPAPLRSQVIHMRCTIGIRSYDPGAWERLCDEYDSWLGTFAEEAIAPERVQRWSQHPYLATLSRLLQDAKSENLDPRSIGGEARAYADLKEDHPDNARTCSGYDLTFASLDNVAAIKIMLKQASREQGGWPALRYLADNVAQRCDEAGWDNTAGLLRSFPAKIKPRHDEAKVIDNILDWWDKIGKPMADLNSRLAELSTKGSVGLARLNAAVTAEIHKGCKRSQGNREDMDSLHGYIVEADKVTREIETFVQQTWQHWSDAEKHDWEREEKVIFSAGTPDLEMFRRWLSEARQFTTDDSASWLSTDDITRTDLTSSAVLNEAWKRQTTTLLGNVTRGDLRRDPKRNASLRKQIEAQRYLLMSLDDQSILPFTPTPDVGDAIQAKREETLQQILALYHGEKVDAFKESPAVQRLCAEYRRWRRELPALATALKQVRTLVIDLYAFDETVPDNSLSIKSVYDTWSANDVWDAGNLSPELSETQAWVSALADIAAENRADKLVRDASEPDVPFPVCLAAWRQLGTLPDWPIGPSRRQQESRLRAAVQRRLADWRTKDPQRKNIVSWELQVEGRGRDVREWLILFRKKAPEYLDPFVKLYTATLDQARRAPGKDATLTLLDEANRVAGALADIVTNSAWPDAYDATLLHRELTPPNPPTMAFFSTWPQTVRELRRLEPDPRGDPQDWQRQVRELQTQAEKLAPYPSVQEACTKAIADMDNLRQALFALPPVQRYADDIRLKRTALAGSLEAYRKEYDLLHPNPIKDKSYWDAVLRSLSTDITELANDRADLRQLFEELTGKVKTLLSTAPIQRNEPSIAEQLQVITDTINHINDEVDPNVWIDRMKARNEVSKTPLANELWRNLRDQILSGVTGDALKANRKHYQQLREQLDNFSTFLGKTKWEKELPPDLPPPMPGLPQRPWQSVLQDRLTALRRTSLEKAARMTPPSDAKAQSIFQAYRRTRAALAKARDELTLADARLQAWTLPREPLSGVGALRIDECLEGWKQHPDLRVILASPGPFTSFCNRLFDLDSQLNAVLAKTSLDELRKDAETWMRELPQPSSAADISSGSAADHPAPLLLHAAYVRLGEIGWPASLEQMQFDHTVERTLLAVVPASRKESLGKTLANEAIRRWGRGFETLQSPDEIFGASLELLRNAYGITAAEARKEFPDLGLHAKVNLVIASLIETIAAGADTRAALEARDQAVAELAALSKQVKYPDPRFVDIQERMTKLKAIEGEGGDEAIRGLGNSGLASAGWKASISADRNTIVFRTTLGGNPYNLTFIRLKPDGEDPPLDSFICTTEITAGLFVDVCTTTPDENRPTMWPAMLSFYPQELRVAGPDPRKGPRTWRTEQTTAEAAITCPPPYWLAETETFKRSDHYPTGLNAGQPSRRHPLQYIPPRAAVFFALKLGCRLPTPKEWQQARSRSNVDTRPPNLRDELWYRQYQHILLLRPPKRGFARFGHRNDKHWPQSDAFPFSTRPPLEDNIFHHGTDGYLWLREVPEAGTAGIPYFADMIGNVAEFTYNDRNELDRLLDRPPLTVQKIRHVLGKPYKFAVVGDSALSPPEHSEHLEEPVRIPGGSSGWSIGFSDVGVRLAFTAPEENLPEKLAELARSLCMTSGQR